MLLGRAQVRWLRKTSLRRVLLLLLVALVLDALFLVVHRPHTGPMPQRVPSVARSAPIATSNRTVFIASFHRDTAPLLHSSWSRSVVDLIEHLGPDAVYFSAVESGSLDGTRAELQQLKSELNRRGVPNTIAFGPTAWDLLEKTSLPPADVEHRPGWVSHDGSVDMRVVPQQAEMRNRAMEPLSKLAANGHTFDTVLWIDDVVFTTEDVLALLDTREGDYAAACSVDIASYGRLHDTSALRDVHGRTPASSLWPWFLSSDSRSATVAGAPAPVYSCWDGLVALAAAPFYASPQPLRFRAIDDRLAELHVEASEKCLLHADNPLSRKAGVWLNPSVRVARSAAAYTTASRSPGWTVAVVGTWVNRIARWRGTSAAGAQEQAVMSRVQQWTGMISEDVARNEPGLPCLVDGMQVMRSKVWRVTPRKPL